MIRCSGAHRGEAGPQRAENDSCCRLSTCLVLTRRLARPRHVQALDGRIIIINQVTSLLLMAVLASVCHLSCSVRCGDFAVTAVGPRLFVLFVWPVSFVARLAELELWFQGPTLSSSSSSSCCRRRRGPTLAAAQMQQPQRCLLSSVCSANT